MIVPTALADACRELANGAAWLERLPEVVADLRHRWSLELQPPFQNGQGSCSWVAPATRADGSQAVLKVGLPHMEAEQAIAGLRFWGGRNTVRLLEADEPLHALLLEACIPGTSLSVLPESEQDAVIGALLPQLWQAPPVEPRFRPLQEMLAYWAVETRSQAEHWPDAGLVRQGLDLFRELPGSALDRVLLFTDLHAGNILRSERAPWLAIDPKPFVGDPAYDATQHLFNCMGRMLADPERTLSDFSARLGVQPGRVRLWTFARAAAEPRREWAGDRRLELARRLAP